MKQPSNSLVHTCMSVATVTFAALALCAGCNNVELAGSGIEQSRTKPTSLSFKDTTAPTLKTEEQVKWLAFLIEHLVDRYPASKNSTDYEIALLLEVSRHDEPALLDGIALFKKSPRSEGYSSWEWYFDVRDTMELIRSTDLAMPHYETPGWGPRMRPLTIKDGRIVFSGVWPSNKEGIWFDPFGTREVTEDIESESPRRLKSTIYALDKKQFGERDLEEFSDQFLSPKKRAELWYRFVKNKS